MSGNKPHAAVGTAMAICVNLDTPIRQSMPEPQSPGGRFQRSFPQRALSSRDAVSSDSATRFTRASKSLIVRYVGLLELRMYRDQE